jgi:hypothetical protein
MTYAKGVGPPAWHEGAHDHCVTNDIDTQAGSKGAQLGLKADRVINA